MGLFDEVQGISSISAASGNGGSVKGRYDGSDWFARALEVVNYASALGSSDETTRENAKRGLTQEAIGLAWQGFQKIWSMIGSKAAKASSDVSSTSEMISENQDLSNRVKELNEKTMEELFSEIDSNITSINKAIATIDSEAKIVEAQQKVIEEKEQKIKEKQDIVNSTDPNVDKGKKADAIDEIIKLGGEIVKAAAIVVAFEKTTNDLTQEVGNYSAEIESIITTASTKLMENIQAIQSKQTRTAGEGTVEITKHTTTGATEIAIGTAKEAEVGLEAGASVFTFGASGLLAAGNQATAADYLAAGHTHLDGAASNMVALGSALGEIGGDYSTVASYATTIGQKSAEALKVIGSYSIKSGALIASVGSYKSIEGINDEMIEKIADINLEEKSENIYLRNNETKTFDFDTTSFTKAITATKSKA